MPELPEVEILVRHLRSLLRNKTVRRVKVFRQRTTRPTPSAAFERTLTGTTFKNVERRGKYLIFLFGGTSYASPKSKLRIRDLSLRMLGHLGMAGRMFIALKKEKLPKHAAIVFDLGDTRFIYEDHRYFGRMTLDLSPIKLLGPEPLGRDFTVQMLSASLWNSRQPIKIKLLDQSCIAGIGNIYASEALFRARISPKLAANKLTRNQIGKLRKAIQEVLNDAIRYGSTVPLKTMSGKSDALFYFSDDGEGFYEKRLRVYNRAGKPCSRCGAKIQRIIQAARSTFFCPHCQRE